MQGFRLRGVIPPIVTPLMPGSAHIDVDALQAHVSWLSDKGVHALMPCGTTGEGPLLTIQERMEVVRRVLEVASGRTPVIAHVGAITTRESIQLAEAATAVGVDALSVVSPYYFRISDDALVAHFCAVAKAVPEVPVFLYNLPQCVGNAITPRMVEETISHAPNVVGLKDSAGDLKLLRDFISLGLPGLQVACGSDVLVFEALKLGASASVSGNANAFPEVVVELFRCYWAGDLIGAARQQALLDVVRNALRNGQSIALIKRAVEMRGLRCGPVRPPLPEVTAEEVETARVALSVAGLLG
ncbi:MAG: dihydrodipicolinate synthase family protein [Anaerolineales bacterium]|nr:dihydrodipicolinate synthase family protein [Anaerolineales bacterium]